MSKAPSNNSLRELWNRFIDNVQSPSSAILSQQALPVKISKDEIIISIKSKVWLDRFTHGGEKYAFIEKAANALFGAPVKKILVRAPQQGDDNIRKEQEPEDEKPAPVPQPMPKAKEEIAPPEEIEEVVTEKEEMKSSDNHVKLSDEFNHTDEVNMVMQLFEGKLIE
jgi:predicted Zn-dependent protease